MKIAIVGLGYVGLPLAHAFAKNGFAVTGFDINAKRIGELQKGHDRTGEVTDSDLQKVKIDYMTDASSLKNADVIILAIPTPVDDDNKPDLSPVEKASETVGKNMKQGAIIVYESTVYPGVTEDLCGTILEKHSGMKCGTDFFLGYSPERMNPGDREHTVEKIVKVVAGQDEKTTDTLCTLYGTVVKAGIHRAPSIKVAEMAKAIENAQRDLNIAFVNEIAVLCNKLGIQSKDVLDAAATKWNFLPFKPGLVGGHCIGVDPYYLVEMAEKMGLKTHVITAGRAINDGMSQHVASQVVDALGSKAKDARILVLGLTFKENVSDTRNSKSGDVIKVLQKAGCTVEAHDPYMPAEEIKKLGWTPGALKKGSYDAVVLLVPHKEYLDRTEDVIKAAKKDGVIYDLKSILDANAIMKAGKNYSAL